ncbi:hypothetical protein ACHAXA_011274 [Cyclostephanos tholiformis]|uniref:Uncharacterized protein n=1 Tax=Cyclostephanos tholiformis TaxID=382380 RepID=A0ABD3SQ18_9STRA
MTKLLAKNNPTPMFIVVTVAIVIIAMMGSIPEIHGFGMMTTTTTTSTRTTPAWSVSSSATRTSGHRATTIVHSTSLMMSSSSSDSHGDDYDDADAIEVNRPPSDHDDGHGRRAFLVASASAVVVVASSMSPSSSSIFVPPSASASGGATAGKYTTIPIAKRRYYGRVQEAVHEFLLMAPAVIDGDLTDASIRDFFDVTKTVVVEGKKKDINGVCTKKDGDCKSTTIYDSRYNDMKTSMYLLGNAFRINQTKAPENLPSVRAAKKFFKQMNKFELLVTKDPKSSVSATKAKGIYVEALDCLDEYLDLVELPPTESGHYDKEFSTSVGENSRIT